MSSQKQFHLEIDMNVLNHLGIGLYSSTPAVVTEIIANAWDADATEVQISIDEASATILVVDNGHGMDDIDLQDRFLRVGYARREQPGGNVSPKYRRPVMGRKGIGKLAMFSLANQIDVWTRKDGADSLAARIDVPKLREAIQKRTGEKYVLEPLTQQVEWNDGTGTRLLLSNLLRGTDKTESFLRPRIARRFSILGAKHSFEVKINNVPVTPRDRGFQKDVQFLWDFDDESRAEITALAHSLAKDEKGNPCIARLDGNLEPQRPNVSLRGFIATVDKPKKLRGLDANINQISLFANGRVFQEDLLGELGNSQVFNSYVVGEVHADFLDSDEIDRATANREAVKHGDALVVLVRAWLSAHLREVAKTWDEWRRQVSPDLDDDKLATAIQTWIDSLKDARDKALADRLVKNISRIEPTNDDDKNREIRRDLFRSTIVGFEKLRIRKQLDRLDGVTDVMSPEFQSIFLNVDDIEATYFHDITRSRLKVIEDFETKIVDPGALEKVAQMYLKDHLWLLDPTWDRISGSEVTELRLSDELKRIAPDNDSGARLDIAYRTSSGRHVIIELKRPGKNGLDVFALLRQGDKYRGAMREFLSRHPDLGGFAGRLPPIDVYFVVEEMPTAVGSDPVEILKGQHMQAFTYKGLIANARRSYEEYLACNRDVSRIEAVVRAI